MAISIRFKKLVVKYHDMIECEQLMHQTIADHPLDNVTVEHDKYGMITYVWMRKNQTSEIETYENGSTGTRYLADEMSGTLEGNFTAEEIENEFNYYWDLLDVTKQSLAKRLENIETAIASLGPIA